MEPDDIPVHDLLGVGGGGGGAPEPGPDDLRAIVARAGRRRLRVPSVGMAVALAAGGGIGYAVSNHSTPAAQTATASGTGSPSSPAAGTAAGGAYSSSVGGAAIAQPVGSPVRFTRLFTRTAGGVTIRAFLWNFPRPSFPMPAGCGVGSPRLEAELSTAQMVGTVAGFSPSDVQTQLVGVAEGDPTGVVTMATTSKVTEVSMSFAGGKTDKMAPINGWVVLAAPVSGRVDYGKPFGTLTERDSNGAVVKSQALTLGVQTGTAASVPCGVFCPKIYSRTSPASSPPATGAIGAPTLACAAPAPPCPSLPTRPVLPGVNGAPVTGAVSGGASSSGAGYACPLLHPSANTP